ncbi:hypothetical protein SCHPADRAFT_996903 [Schizopora paradoxa]|uniref:DH domain-containing protein n=1 Tax=Schizopora paradoxa TaxID=27342 RepID=A0A0H2RX60_9AGAM|nr:hypothetical protein SCHPADRAFT_996903 [Schizopora paradoxa]
MSTLQADELLMFINLKQTFKNREEDYTRRLEEGIRLYVSPLELSTPHGDRGRADDIYADIDVKGTWSIREIANVHRSFQSIIPSSTSPEHEWVDFFHGANSAIRELYIEYVALIPLAIKRFEFEYLRNAAYRNSLENEDAAKEFFYLPWSHLNLYTRLLLHVEKLPGVGELFSDVAVAAEKIHFDANMNMLRCMSVKDMNEEIFPKWFRIMAIHARPVWTRDTYTSKQLAMDILMHEAWYVKQLVDVHEVFIKALEDSLYPLKGLTSFLSSTMGGLTEMALTHQELLRDLLERQIGESPALDASNALDIVFHWLTHLDGVYSDYFLNREDRRFLLTKTRKEDERFDRFVEILRSPQNVDPMDMDEILNLPLQYFQFFNDISLKIPKETASGTPLHTTAARLRKIVMPPSKLTKFNDRFTQPAPHALDLLDSNRQLLFSYTGQIFNDKRNAFIEVGIVILDNYLLMLRANSNREREVSFDFVNPPLPVGLVKSVTLLDPLVRKQGGKSTELYPISLELHDFKIPWRRDVRHDTETTRFFLESAMERDLLSQTLDSLSSDNRDSSQELSAENKLSYKSIEKNEVQYALSFYSRGKIFVAIEEHLLMFDLVAHGLIIMDLSTENLSKFNKNGKTYKQAAVVGEGSSVLLSSSTGFDLFSTQDYLKEVESAHPDMKRAIMPSSFLSVVELPAKSGIPIWFSVGRMASTIQRECIAYVTKERLRIRSGYMLRRLTIDASSNIESVTDVIKLPANDEPLDVVVLSNAFALLFTMGTIMIVHESGEMVHKIEANRPVGYFPFGIIRANKDTILICGEDGGIYRNSDGSPITTTTSSNSLPLCNIEWELQWEKMVFVPPLIFGFSNDLVEIRNVYTGGLVQIVKLEGKYRHVSRFIWTPGDAGHGDDGRRDGEASILSKWCLVAMTDKTIVRFLPRLAADSFDRRLFDVEFKFTEHKLSI